MMQLDMELFPIVVGFSSGITIFVLQWIFPMPGAARRKEQTKGSEKLAAPAKGAEEEVEDGESAPTATAEPMAEPGPEDAPEAAAAPRAARQPRPTLALLGLFGVLVVAQVVLAFRQGGPSTPPAVVELLDPAVPQEVAAQAAVLSSEPELPPMEAALPAPAAEVVPEPVVASEVVDLEAAALAPQAEAAVEPAQVEAQTEEVEAAEQEGEEAEEEVGAEQEEEVVVKPITLNLTRQTMAIHNVGDIIHYKSAYWGTIAVGTPAVDYKVVFDTGSGYLILPSTYCHSETCRAHKRYRRPASITAKDIDFDGTQVGPGEPRDEMTISFGTGEVTGVLVDDITCADDRGVSLNMPLEGCMPMSMIIATDMTEEPFRTFNFDGVMGLGLVGLSKSVRFSFIHNIAKTLEERGGRTPNIFSVFLGQHRREASDITFGGYVEDHLEDEISWNSVLHPELGHWMLKVKSVRIDDEVIQFCNEGCRAIVDTGTSLLAVPTPAFPEIHELLRHEAHPSLDCKGPGPKLHIELEGLTLSLEPQDYSRSESALFGNPPQSRVKNPFEDQNSTADFEPEYCKPTLMSMELPAPVGPKLFVLGEPVLRKYYTVFDFTEEAPRIGFGVASHRGHPSSSPVENWAEDEDDDEEGWRSLLQASPATLSRTESCTV